MEVFGMALAGLYAIVAAASVSSASADATCPLPIGGNHATRSCSSGNAASAPVARANTPVSVICARGSTVGQSAPANGGKKSKLGADSPAGEAPAPVSAAENVYLSVECTLPGVLSSVCPGATVTPAASHANSPEGSGVNVFFPQLPAPAQVVCLKCQRNGRSGDCTAVINVAAAPP